MSDGGQGELPLKSGRKKRQREKRSAEGDAARRTYAPAFPLPNFESGVKVERYFNRQNSGRKT